MNITISNAHLEQVPEPDKGYIGKVELVVEGHAEPYEVTLFTKRGKEWDYSLHFLNEPGKEEEILALETLISEDDDTFDRIIDAVWDYYEAHEENPSPDSE